MIEQKVIIELTDEQLNEFGTLTISSLDYKGNKRPNLNISNSIMLENILSEDNPDNMTPIQYCPNIKSNFAKLLFLEETEYQILFESKEVDATFDILYSLTKVNNNHFKPFRFILSDNDTYRVAGTLNFRSYVGKSFLDVKKDGISSIKIPIEVRSKKMDYFNQYSAMIADLSQQSLSLIFDTNSPLYQYFEIDYSQKETYYEDFMFLEYIFRQDNLPTVFEYLSKNLHSQLKNHVETVPLSFASNVNHNTLKSIICNSNKMFKSQVDLKIVDKLNGYLPYEIEQIKHEDIIDIPENRFFKFFLELLYDLIEKLLKTSKKGYTKDKLLLFKDDIEYYLSNKYFNHISSMEYVPFNSQILQKKEGYREIFQYFLMLEFSFRLSWEDVNNQFKGFEKKLSELYEYWCYFKLLKVLNNLSVNKIDFEDIFEINKNNWSKSIKSGSSSAKKFYLNLHNHNIEINLFYKLYFTDETEYKSYSLPFEPDYTLLIKIAEDIYYIHFDAKYRSELEIVQFYNKLGIVEDFNSEICEKKYNFKKEDIYKMHTYKDSILDTKGAYVLYPGNAPNMFYESDFIIPSVGAFSLTPGNDDVDENNLEIFIKNVLGTLLFRKGLINKELISFK